MQETRNIPEDTFEQNDNPTFQILHIDNSSPELSSPDCGFREITKGGICICVQGKSLFSFNRQSCTIRKGDLCILFPHTLLQIDNKSDDFSAYYIISRSDLSSAIRVPDASQILFIRDNPCISLDEAAFRRMTEYCGLLAELDRNDHAYRNQIGRHLLFIMYYEIVDRYQHGQPLTMHVKTRQETMAQRFIELVSRHYAEQREIGYYAGELCVTPKYLSSVVRSITGQGAAWWINQVVVTHAKNLLKQHPQLTIQQISDRLNFPNPSFFGQYFKRRVGMTPKEFRKRPL